MTEPTDKKPTAIYIGAMERVDGPDLKLYNVFNCPGLPHGSTRAEVTIQSIPNINIIEEVL